MQSTLNPKLSDDPHDFVVVPPDAIRVAPDEELSNLLQKAARQRSETQASAASDVHAAASVPPVDTTFRPTAANDVGVPVLRRSIGSRVLRPLIALLLAGCVGFVAVTWRSHGDTIKKQIAKWTTKAVVTLSLQPETSEPAAAETATPAAATDTANAAPVPPAAPAESTAAAAAAAPAAADPSADQQLLQSMASDLASLGQEVEQLKASLAELKASQQASRDAAKASEAAAKEAKEFVQACRAEHAGQELGCRAASGSTCAPAGAASASRTVASGCTCIAASSCTVLRVATTGIRAAAIRLRAATGLRPSGRLLRVAVN